MLENITIAIPTNWNEMISVDNYFNNDEIETKYFQMPFLNVDLKKADVKFELNETENKITFSKQNLIELFEKAIDKYDKSMSKPKYNPKTKAYKNAVQKPLNILKLMEDDLNLDFHYYKSEKILNTFLFENLEYTPTLNAYILNVFDVFDKIDQEKLKKQLKNKIYFLPLNELDKKGLLKNINPIIKKEIGCITSDDAVYLGYQSIIGFRNNSSLYIKEKETKEYSRYLESFLELRFGNKEKISSDFKETFFDESLKKEIMIKEKNLNKKIKTSKYLVYTDEKTISATFDSNTEYCKMKKEYLNKEVMKVTYYARNGSIMSEYYIKTTDSPSDYKKMNEAYFKLSDLESCISVIHYEKNIPKKHILRLKNERGLYKNLTKSILLLLKKYNSKEDILITSPIEKRLLNIMKRENFTIVKIRRLLRQFNFEIENELSEETLDLIEMKYSI